MPRDELESGLRKAFQGRVALAPPDGAMAPESLLAPDELVVVDDPGALTVSSVFRLQAPRLIAAAKARAMASRNFIFGAYISVFLSKRLDRMTVSQPAGSLLVAAWRRMGNTPVRMKGFFPA